MTRSAALAVVLTQKTTQGAPAPGTQQPPQRPAPRHEQTEHGQGAEELQMSARQGFLTLL